MQILLTWVARLLGPDIAQVVNFQRCVRKVNLGQLTNQNHAASITGVSQFVLHKQADLAGTLLEGVNYPRLETPDAWIVHGFTYPNYLEALGKDAQSEIYTLSSLDPALKDSSAKLRDFLMNGMNLSEDEAFSLITVEADFAITQVVDGDWGVHGIIPKGIFDPANVKPKPRAS